MRIVVCVAALLWGAGCVEVAEERANNEDRIGRRAAHGLTVRVDEGLAAVRALEHGRVELWAQAPTLTVRLTAAEAGQWTLDLRNAMPDVVLDGAPARPIGRSVPTHRSWLVDLPAGETILRLAPPDAADPSPWTFVAFADVQDRLDGVQDLFGRMATEPGVRFGLISGDLTEQGDAATLRRFQRHMEALPFPLFATLGNHELGAGTASPPFHDLFGRGSFSFAYRGVRFTLLDSASATLAPRTYDKLDRWLAAGRDGLHLAMMHIPPLDAFGLRNGAFASRGEAHKLLGLLARAGVDVTVYGHVHTFKAYTNVGIDAYITGGGGAIPERLDGIGRHFMTFRAEPAAGRIVPGVVRISPAD